MFVVDCNCWLSVFVVGGCSLSVWIGLACWGNGVCCSLSVGGWWCFMCVFLMVAGKSDWLGELFWLLRCLAVVVC